MFVFKHTAKEGRGFWGILLTDSLWLRPLGLMTLHLRTAASNKFSRCLSCRSPFSISFLSLPPDMSSCFSNPSSDLHATLLTLTLYFEDFYLCYNSISNTRAALLCHSQHFELSPTSYDEIWKFMAFGFPWNIRNFTSIFRVTRNPTPDKRLHWSGMGPGIISSTLEKFSKCFL